MSPVLTRLPILILSPHGRCNCRCVMCDIWKNTDSRELSAEELERHLDSIEQLNVEWVVFTGGEPLMHSDLFRLCALLKARRVRLTLLTTGLLIARNASAIAQHFDDVIVSLDGPPAIHNEIRRVPMAFETLRAGVQTLRDARPDLPINARCTVQRSNCGHLYDTAKTALSIRLNSVSFLAADLTSTAFNRPNGWTQIQTETVGLENEEIGALEAEVDRLLGDPELSGFILESEGKLRRIVNHFRAHLGLTAATAPNCNAPWVSAVLEADGTVRPCFFHPSIGKVEGEIALANVLNSPAASEFRAHLDVARNPVCRRCVCSLNFTAR